MTKSVFTEYPRLTIKYIISNSFCNNAEKYNIVEYDGQEIKESDQRNTINVTGFTTGICVELYTDMDAESVPVGHCVDKGLHISTTFEDHLVAQRPKNELATTSASLR